MERTTSDDAPQRESAPPRMTAPGSSPVTVPSSSTSLPFTSTVSMPSGGRGGIWENGGQMRRQVGRTVAHVLDTQDCDICPHARAHHTTIEKVEALCGKRRHPSHRILESQESLVGDEPLKDPRGTRRSCTARTSPARSPHPEERRPGRRSSTSRPNGADVLEFDVLEDPHHLVAALYDEVEVLPAAAHADGGRRSDSSLRLPTMGCP